MILFILVALEVFFIQTLLAPIARWLFSSGTHIRQALGPRDEQPPIPVWGERLDRALRNMIEAMFVFLPLALICEFNGIATGLAVWGAGIFVVARLCYVPAYVSGIPGLRSAIWTAGHTGLALMAFAILQFYFFPA